MPSKTQCRTKDCTGEALNKVIVLKSGGSALCQYCPKHASEIGFIVKTEGAAPVPPKAKPAA